MPVYDYLCNHCEREHEQLHGIKEMPCWCPHCGGSDLQKVINRVPTMRMADKGWEYESDGKGRYIGQLAARPDVDDPSAYCRSQGEAIEKAKQKGWQTITKS